MYRDEAGFGKVEAEDENLYWVSARPCEGA